MLPPFLRPGAARVFAVVCSLALSLLAPNSRGAAFTPGNLVVVRVGSGSGSLVSTGNPVFLDEYTTAGALVQSIALPTAPSGSNHAFFLSGTATSEGALSQSANGQYLALAGYATSDGTTNLPGSTGSAVNRVAARVDATGAIDTSTALSDFATGGNPRSATTNDGTAFWLAGSSNGLRYAVLGATTSTSISTTVTNLRVTQIFGGQLYVSDSSGTAIRVGTVGSGLPIASGQTLASLPGFPTTGSPYGYFFCNLSGGANADTLYVADDAASGGIQKYSLVSGTWTANGTVTAPSVRGLTGSVNGTTVTLYGTTGASGGAGSSAIYQFVDATGFNAAVSGAATSLASAATNTAFRGIAFAPGGSTGVVVPAVSSTIPANHATGVAPGSTISITFNQAVNVTDNWFTITGGTSGDHPANVSNNGAAYVLSPTTAFAEGETVTVSVLAALVTDAATGTQHPAADFTSSFTTSSSTPLAIHAVQGGALTSAYVGQSVRVQGVVIASFQAAGQIGGYYLETPDADQDADPATSEGIYVFDNTNSVTTGDFVTVAGTVAEFGTAPSTETEISQITSFAKNSTGNALPSAASVTLPFPNIGYAERYEGMRVALPQTLTVTNNFDYGHFGELTLSNGRLPTPTNIVAPGAPAQTQEAANKLNQLLLDDDSSAAYPSPTPFLNGSDPALATRRTGDTTTGVTGVIANKFGAYVVEPTAAPSFVDANPRPAAPASLGSLRVAIGNVENFMNGDGSGGGFPTSRGATTLAEYQRQLPKVTAGILKIAPDIMGLTEIENDRVTNGTTDSYGPTSAIAELVASLNASAPAGTTYAFVNAAAVDVVTDQIHCALIYRTETVEEAGTPAMLDDPAFDNVARNPLAQTFRQKSTGEKLTVCINHFRAKGSAAAGAGNTDSGDGQGTNNALRVQEADAVTAWLNTFPTGDHDPDILVIGDLNAYAKEDPLTHILNAGYISLTERFEGEGGYSYQFQGEFGHLDHALATSHLNGQVLSAATWHVNSDEPVYYDYNTENKDATQLAINAGTPYRYSDHDPVVIGVGLTSPPAITVKPVSQTTTVGAGSVTFTVVATGTPAPTYQWRKDGADVAGATSASLTIDSPVVADSGSYEVVVTNVLGSVTSDPFTLTVNPAAAAISLGNLQQPYDGAGKSITAATSPISDLPLTVTYGGESTPPIYPGSYPVVATIADPNYFGSTTGTLVITVTALVRHAPSLSGGLGGSLQLLTPESFALNGSGWVSGDLLVPGTPSVMKSNKAIYGSTIDGDGTATPTNYSITLSNGSVLRHVVRRIDAISFPIVSTPPEPTGTRNVTLNSAGQNVGDFSTLRNLTLNSNVGQIVVPAGTYGSFTANKNSGFTLGISGGTEPAVYNLQALTLNSASQIQIIGPVIINLAGGATLGGSVGSAQNPAWLKLNISSGGMALNGDVDFNGIVVAPSGTITINSKSTLNGRITSDRLTINSGGLLDDAEL